jgi:hypothetical protein
MGGLRKPLLRFFGRTSPLPQAQRNSHLSSLSLVKSMPQTQAQPALEERDQEEHAMSPNEQIEYFRSIGRLEAQVASLIAAVTELKTKVDGIDTRLDQLDRLANRWKGGFAVILTLGALAGFILDNVIRWWTAKGS